MKDKCEVKYCQEKKCWRVYGSDGKAINDQIYSTKDAAVSAGRCHCEETGDELCIYNKNGELTSKRRINNQVGD